MLDTQFAQPKFNVGQTVLYLMDDGSTRTVVVEEVYTLHDGTVYRVRFVSRELSRNVPESKLILNGG